MILDYTHVILDILDRLSDYDYVVRNAEDFKVDARNKLSAESSLFSGLPSLALLFGEYDKIFSDKNFALTSHMYMAQVIGAINSNNFNPGVSLSTGMTGIAFALQSVKSESNDYLKLQSSLNSYILYSCSTLIEKKHFFDSFNEDKYDFMSGLCGVLNYMRLFSSNVDVRFSISQLLSIFIDKIRRTGVFGCSVKLADSCLPQTSRDGYYINLGISHGVAAIIILFIKFYKQGFILDFHEETISIIANWLLKQRQYDSNNLLFWPSAVYFDCEKNSYTRDAWCYGTPGISYSLLLAGLFLNNNQMIEVAISGMKDSLKRQKDVLSPTFCHGLSGLYFLSKRFFFKTNKKCFREMCIDIKNKIFSFYSSKFPFGFVNVEKVNGQLVEFNHINLLSGVSGVLLTLADDIDNPNSAKWEHIFLIDA